MISATHTSALAAVIAGVTPIVIYFLLRRRKTEVAWGAGYLLRQTLASRKRTSVWRQYVVLALRCLVIVCIALLLSGLFREGSPGTATPTPARPEAPLHRIVLVDHSLSMTVGAGQVPRFSRLKTALRALLLSQRPGDRLTMVSLTTDNSGDWPRIVVGRQRADQAAAVLARIAPAPGTVRLQPAFAAAMSAAAQTPDAAVEIYVLSDFSADAVTELPRLSWLPAAVRAHNARVAAVSMTAPGLAAPPSVTVDDLAIGSDLLVAGMPVHLYATVSNRADVETAARLTLTADGNEAGAFPVPLKPNETRRLPLTYTPGDAGGVTLTVTAVPGPLATASARSLSVDVRPALTVWLVADPPPPTDDGALSEAEFVRRSLAPEDAETAAGAISLEEVDLNMLATAIPDTVDVIVLAGPRVVTPSVTEPLRAFIRRGGGLVTAMSAAVDESFYNDNLAELLGAQLLGPAREQVEPEVFATAEHVADERVTLFDEFATVVNGELAAVRFYNHMRVAVADDSGAAVVLALRDGAPLLLSRPFGRGRAVLVTSSLGMSWSSLPVRQSFVPFLYRLMNHAAGGRTLPRNIEVGDVFIGTWPEAEPVTLTAPAGGTSAVSPTPAGGRHFVVASAPAQPGTYRLSAGAHATAFTVRGSAPEADLRPLRGAAQGRLESALTAPVHPSWTAAVDALGADTAAHELWSWLLVIMLLCYLTETWVVRHV
jgi:hypothetical protein